MQRTGLVMSIEKNHICVMTSSGGFMRISIIEGNIPIMGQMYTGDVVNANTLKSNIFIKYKVMVASFIFFAFLGFGIYTYFTPVTAATIDINPSIKLLCNKYSKTIYINALNNDGKKIVSEISLKNLNLDQALVKIVDQSIKDNFINSEYLIKKSISLNITGKDISTINFQNKIKQEKLKSKIKINGKTKEIKKLKEIVINHKIKENKLNSNDITNKQNKSINYKTNVKVNRSVKGNGINTITSNTKKIQNSNIVNQKKSYLNINEKKNIFLDKRDKEIRYKKS